MNRHPTTLARRHHAGADLLRRALDVASGGKGRARTDRDPMIIVRSVREFTGDGIYLFVWDDLPYVKRLQKASSD